MVEYEPTPLRHAATADLTVAGFREEKGTSMAGKPRLDRSCREGSAHLVTVKTCRQTQTHTHTEITLHVRNTKANMLSDTNPRTDTHTRTLQYSAHKKISPV